MAPLASESAQAWPGPIHRLETVDSTSSWLRAAAQSGAPPWTCVLAERQTAGRGRRGRSWESPPGGLYLSVLLERPTGLSPAQAGLVSLLAGVAVVRAVGAWGLDARLKWPNDVRVAGRKLAGILVEALSRRDALVVGIGVNVNRDPRAGKAPLTGEAAWLSELLGRELSVEQVALGVVRQLVLWQAELVASGPEAVIAAWRSHAEDWCGRRVNVTVAGAPLRAVVLDVAPSGALLVEDEVGARRELPAGDVEGLELSSDGQRHGRA